MPGQLLVSRLQFAKHGFFRGPRRQFQLVMGIHRENNVILRPGRANQNLHVWIPLVPHAQSITNRLTRIALRGPLDTLGLKQNFQRRRTRPTDELTSVRRYVPSRVSVIEKDSDRARQEFTGKRRQRESSFLCVAVKSPQSTKDTSNKLYQSFASNVFFRSRENEERRVLLNI